MDILSANWSEWFEDHIMWVFFGAILLALLGLGFALAHDATVRQGKCEVAMTMARSSTDSLAVFMRCELPERTNSGTVVYPVVVPVR